MESIYYQNGSNFHISTTQDGDVYKKLPPGNYIVKFNQLNGFYLEKAPKFELPKKIYGNTNKIADRIWSTFKERKNNTGVLLEGEKGSGKTLLAKVISCKGYEENLPTIIINEKYVGDAFASFIQKIQECIIIFEEFEKVYKRNGNLDKDDPDQQSVTLDPQEKILTLFDGVFASKKLCILTCNDDFLVNENMINRPGRLYYNIKFEGVDANFINDYCKENLNDFDKNISSLHQVASFFKHFNFDMLQSIVEEMNRYGETAMEVIKYLNVKPSSIKNDYVVTAFKGEKDVSELLYGKILYGINPINNGSITVSVYRTAEKNNYDHVNLSAKDLIEVNHSTQSFTYVKNGYKIILQLDKKPEFNYQALMSQINI